MIYYNTITTNHVCICTGMYTYMHACTDIHASVQSPRLIHAIQGLKKIVDLRIPDPSDTLRCCVTREHEQSRCAQHARNTTPQCDQHEKGKC